MIYANRSRSSWFQGHGILNRLCRDRGPENTWSHSCKNRHKLSESQKISRRIHVTYFVTQFIFKNDLYFYTHMNQLCAFISIGTNWLSYHMFTFNIGIKIFRQKYWSVAVITITTTLDLENGDATRKQGADNGITLDQKWNVKVKSSKEAQACSMNSTQPLA